jgi:hypothetical protein
MNTITRNVRTSLIATLFIGGAVAIPAVVFGQADLTGMTQAQIDSLNNGPPMGLGAWNGHTIGYLGTPYESYNFSAVLGASTSLPELPAGCSPMLKSFMRADKQGFDNDSSEVMKLQKFLNEKVAVNLPITGEFGPLTDAAVKKFQESFMDNILSPWGINEGTGFVYLTTQRWINLMSCPNLDLPMPKLVPYVQTR